MNPTKKAQALKKGDRIILGQGDTPPVGTVDFVYKCHQKVHILVQPDGAEMESRSFEKSDLISLAK